MAMALWAPHGSLVLASMLGIHVNICLACLAVTVHDDLLQGHVSYPDRKQQHTNITSANA